MSRRPRLNWLGLCLIGALAGCHDMGSRPTKARTGDTAGAIPAPGGPAAANHRTTRPPEVHSMDVRNIHWSADGSLLATDSSDGSVTVWSTDQPRPDDPSQYGRYTLDEPLHAVSVQSNGRILVENTRGRIRVRDLATGRVLQTLDQSEHVFEWPFFLSPNGTKVYSF